ncbi:non-ribosomal peptide synthetase [Flavobacterium hercynium]|uniref:Carrier domain-containing protein n=1 Tax=Flavobacterium hercynium TaxID=387094 RepID=A0A226H7C8_9FLAO|nr:non-ribosomal peptide synthetase [Flavobacterium hercynium]OXA89994.1 hypothetical protein B0A66_13385 [Flavobacterium hercynium]SMP14176.1 amino acid adenylation domain-containing protein [Flavobacterium hercynium]
MQVLLKKLNSLHIKLALYDGKLDIKAPKGVMTKELLEEIKLKKESIIDFIERSQSANSNHISIPVIEQQENYTISSAQKRLWLICQHEDQSAAYNISRVLEFKGDLNTEVLQKAFAALLERHESLRTVFVETPSAEIRQRIVAVNDLNFKIAQIDYSNQPEAMLKESIEKEIQRPFDLAEDCLVRVSLLEKAEDHFVFVLVIHHIVSDGWSMEIMVNELFTLYNVFLSGYENPLLPLPIQYKDYALWQQNQITQEDNQAHKKFWLKQFEGEVSRVDLPVSHSKLLNNSAKGNSINTKIEAEVLKKFSGLCQSQDATLFMGLVSVWNILFYKYTSQTDIIIGSPIAGRVHADLQNQIGFYVNTLALRTQFEEKNSFSEILSKVRTVTLGAFEHQIYPFDELIENINLKREPNKNPLFESLLTLQNIDNFETKSHQTGGLQIQDYAVEEKILSKFDLELTFNEFNSELNFNLTFNTEIYTFEFAENIATHFSNILQNVIEESDIPVSELDYLAPNETKQLLSDFNATNLNYPQNKTIVDLLNDQALKTPNAVAVVYEDTELTYKELNEITNQLGHYLKKNYAIAADNLVGIKLDRSEKMIVALLGILKSGAAYVPIDPTYPQERIEYIEKDAACKIIIDADSFEQFEQVRNEYAASNPETNIQLNDLAYIIYTSGTTGNPKGVMVEHRNVVNLIKTQTEEFKIDETERILQVSNLSFDASVEQIFLALCNGAALYILPKRVLVDDTALEHFIFENKITHFHSVPSVVSKLKPSDKFSLKRVVSGGDTCSEKLAASWETICDFYNEYGPTETTVTSIEFLYDSKAPFSIGRPIGNTQVYILANTLQPTPVNVWGKIYISGAGVTRGYLNKPELTAEKFIENPFELGTKMYDTGDLGRWLPDGTIEFLGRNDHQVKVRGYRIELGEIETSLLQFSADIKEVVVEVKELHQEKTLVAYYIAEVELDKSEIRNYLQSKLPEYMVPSFYVALESLPLTPNGKVDRKALPGISGEDSIRKEYVAPRNPTEQKVAEIWQEVFGIERVGITDNFFELGGHSLMVAQIINRINKQLNQTVSFKNFFANPTIETLCKVLSQVEYLVIPQAVISESYPLTGSQYRLWIMSQLENGSVAYNMPSVVKLKGDLDKVKFNETFTQLIQRHEILRTSFKSDAAGNVRQFITPTEEINFSVSEKDFTHVSNQEVAVLEYLNEQNSFAFDLEKAPLIRASLLKLNEKEHVFFLSMHHIIGDGWSMELIVNEIVKIYNAGIENQAVDLPRLNIQYKDYAVWINEKTKEEEFQKSKEFWLNQFTGQLPALELPTFKKRPLAQTYNGADIAHAFSASFLEKIKTFSKNHDLTLFMTLMTGIKVLLSKYAGQDDIIIGTPIAGREHPDLENQIGLYLNTLAIRTTFEEGDNFSMLLNKEKETLLNAYQHQNYPFDELVGNLNLKRDLSRSALFDVMVVLQNQAQLNNVTNDTNLAGLQVEGFDFENNTAKFDLNFTFVEAEQLMLNITYNTDIYDAEFVESIFEHLENVYDQIISNPAQSKDSIDYLTIAEKTRIIEGLNNTHAEYPKDKTIIDLFEEQVAKTPNNIAVLFEETTLTYQQLNEKANQLGHYLRANHAIKTDDLIGIKLERSENMIVTLLGILKSGAAYVPIDLAYPQERIEYIEKDSNAKIVIDQQVLEQFYAVQNQYDTTNLEKINSVNDLAYIIYTSGTTGNPKGVMIEHSNAVALIHWSQAEFDATRFDTVYAVTSYCFDLSVFEIFYTLSIGKKIKILKNGLELKNHIGKDKNTLINTVPSVVSQLLDDNVSFDAVGILNMAGEPIAPNIIQRLPVDQIEVYNLYGPSEDTTYSTYFKITQKEYPSIPIGKPITNSQVYILDNQLQVVSRGVFGKIYVAGDGVARGYLNKPELTAEKFVANPFQSNGIMYDTGDLGRWLPDGTIEFLGRKDHQVKIRGFRIELGEIEARLLQFSEQIKQVVVEPKEVKGEKLLVAYFASDNELSKSEIRAYLQSKLPEYMVPIFYVALESLPLTPNGKIDRKALPGISGEDTIRKEYIAPRNETEQQIAAIWQEVLGVDQVGITDNFFDLGGHSLLVAQVINRFSKQLNQTISFKDFFANPTIESLFTALNQDEYMAIPQAVAMESYPLTPSQYRFWILNQLEGSSLAYNMPAAIKLKGALNTRKFEEILRLLTQRHEILRTSFKNNEKGQIRQYITPSNEINFEVTQKDFTNQEQQKEAVLQYLEQQNSITFDLEQAPLLRASLIKLNENEHVFYLNIHHIIGDGWSMELLVSEIVKTYNAVIEENDADLQPLKIHYKDYAVWMNEAIQQEKYQKSKAYWLNQFSGEMPVLELPSFKKRPLVQTYNGENQSREFSGVFLEKLKAFSKAQDVTLFMTLMAGIKTLLQRYTGQNDIIIGTPIAGREHPDLENQIGLYLNTLAIRTKFEEGDDFLTVLSKEKETLLNAYQHQIYPFDELVGSLNLKRDLSRSALFDVMLVLQNQAQLNNIDNTTSLTGLQVEPFEFEDKTSKLDISFTFVETEALMLNIDFNPDVYDAVFVASIFNHLENVFNEVLDDPTLAIETLDYLTIAEELQLLLEFNKTKAEYPKDKSMIDLFEEQVEKTPNNIAVLFEENTLTYKELNKKANQLGHYLRSNHAIKTDDLIGIKLERSENMIATLLGILKSGAAYVPIDLAYPQERIEYIEKDSNAKIVIDQQVLESFFKVREQYDTTNLTKINSPNDLAYIIYTSGTTGNPKGVMIEHSNAVALIHWSQAEFDTTRFDTVYAVTSYCFDLSVFEIFYTLSIGKKIKILKNGLELKNHIEEDKNTLINTVPSVVSQLLDDNVSFDSVGILNMAGEPIAPNIIQRLPVDKIEVYNLYGPSEDTTYSTYFKITQKEYPSIPIGKPITNSQVYILDAQLQVVSRGVFGKIYVAGDGVARGYLNKPELTAEKFVANPFKSGKIMYDTGDLGRWLPDGTIEFLGRKDHQVKIRGFRIELGEIEARLLQFSEQIKQVVVEPKEVKGEKLLVAYFASENELSKSEIRTYLQSKLPEYMVPTFYVDLESLPLTPNGKIDRKALPGISGEDTIRKEYTAPRNETEQQIAAIWQEVLGVEQVGITDNFFDLGGHSLLVAQVINRFSKQLNHTISFKDFFANPTIESLFTVLNQNEYVAIPQAIGMESYPLTPSQYRFWILSQLEGSSLAYNMPSAIKLKGKLNTQKFEESFKHLIQRHEILRTSFKNDENEQIRQYITASDSIIFKVKEKDFTNKTGQKQAVLDYLQEQNNIVFNLEQAPLVRASLIKLKENEYVFYLNIHHIIGDGWSMELLVSEIVKIYNAIIEGNEAALPKLNIHYKDYAVWMNEAIQQEKYQKSKMYWLNQFSGELPALELPTFKKRPLVQTYNGADTAYQFSSEFLEKVKTFSKNHDLTLFMTLMTGIKVLLSKYAGQDDIIIGTPIAGREHPDLENQIGLYLNTLVIRTKFEESDNFLTLLNKEKETLLNAYQHQNYPFDELVGNLNLKRDLSRSALFDVMVVLQNQAQLNNVNNDTNLAGLQVEGFDFENNTAKFDLSFTFVEAEQLLLNITYNTDIYDAEFTESIFEHLENVYDQIISDPTQSKDVLDYLTIGEKTGIIEGLNNTQAQYPKDKTMIDLFEEQVAKTPNNIAVLFEETTLTYQELNEKANQLGHYLRANHAIKTDDLIGIKLERSENMIVTLLGILKSGAAYVPIDLAYPQERIEYIEKDSNAKIVIDQQVLEQFYAAQNQYDTTNLKKINSANDLAYIIYTSGTTGNPKGVMIEHSNAVALIHWSQAEFDSTRFDTVYAVTSYCFDLSVFEIFYTLSIGKKIKILKNGLELKNHIEKDKNTLINTVPSVVSQLLDDNVSFDSVGILNMAGEPIAPNIIQRLPVDQIEVYNLYGPSEDTTYSTYFKIKQKEYPSIPIGKPITNSQVYILDAQLQVVSRGVFGKIYVAGDGVARGYLNKPELTAEKFVTNPFQSNGIMYDTGDLGRWLPDGTIEFLGRKDHQVKIRGFRIELGEIEARLLQFSEQIKQVVVEPKEVKGEKLLVAYFASENEISKSEIRAYLQSKLPEYMVPTFYVALESLPLTPNGKIDRKALPGISGEDTIHNEYVAPRDKTEQRMAEIWQEVLCVDQVGITDNFFELGGHSISAINVTTRINKEFSINYPLDSLFHYNSIAELVKYHVNATLNKDYFEFGNNKSENVLFAFPPISGFGNGYRDLFHNNDDWKFIAFNFIENENSPATYYANRINEMQPKGDIVLFGWSAGGILSYEVANQLTTKLNRKVSRIIMFDSIVIDKETINDDFLFAIQDPDEKTEDYMKEILIKAEEKLMSYINYLKTVEYKQKLNVNLELVKVSDAPHERWEEFFENVIYTEGQGEHYQMLKDDNLKYNKKVLNKMLNTNLKIEKLKDLMSSGL